MLVENSTVLPVGSYFATNTPPNPFPGCKGFTSGKSLVVFSRPLTYTLPAASKRGGAMMATSPAQQFGLAPTRVDQTRPLPRGFILVRKPVFWQPVVALQELGVFTVTGKS